MAERPQSDEIGTGETRLTPEQTVILLADDNPVLRNLIQLRLVKEGYAVLTASDGQEAVEILDTFKDPIHLLVSDVQMPRMDGWTLAETVRRQRPDTKIIVISGAMATTILRENPADALMKKPFVPPALLECIQRVLVSGFKGVCENTV